MEIIKIAGAKVVIILIHWIPIHKLGRQLSRTAVARQTTQLSANSQPAERRSWVTAQTNKAINYANLFKVLNSYNSTWMKVVPAVQILRIHCDKKMSHFSFYCCFYKC